MPQSAAARKQPNTEAEEIILGTCFIESSADPLTDLDPQQFFSRNHQEIARAILTLKSIGKPIDFIQALALLEEWHSGVSPSKVSGLTDGIPFGLKPESLAWYRNEIKRLWQERETRKELYQVGEAAAAGEPVEDLQRRAVEVLEKIKPAPKTSAKKPKGEYSVIPEAAWYKFTELYRLAMEKTCSASDNYHFAGFLTVVGSLLGKTVYYDDGGEELYPNIFTVIVGEAGWAKKDSALRRAVRFTRDLDNSLTMIYTLASVEGFIDELVREQKELQTKGHSPTPLRILLRLSELRNLISKAAQKGTGNIIPTICEAYDCPPTLKTPTRSHYAQADEPILSVFACTNPNWLRTATVEDLEAGFGSRVIFIPGDPKPLWPKKHKPNSEYLRPLLDVVGKRLEQYRLAPRAFILSPEAEEIWNKWVIPHDALRVENRTINLMAARDPTTCLKVALNHAALDDAERIEVYHLKAAICFVEWLYEVRFPLFAGHGMTPNAEIDAKIIDRVKESAGGIWWRDIRRSLQRIDYETFEKRMKSLLFGFDPPLKVTEMGLSKKPWVALRE